MSKRRQENDLSAFLSGRVEDLRRLAPRRVRSWDTGAIHDARVTTRRLKSAIDLLEPLLPEETRVDFAATLRRLRRALGPVRDLDVMLMHLADFRRKERFAAPARWLARQLQERRAKLQRRATRKAPVSQVLKGLGGWWAIEPELVDTREVQASLLKRAVPQELESFVKRADRLTRVRTGEGSQATEDVHALRIDGKLLRYRLELAEPLGFAIGVTLFRSFKRLQDSLGLWHDLVVLGEQCLRTALDQELPLHNPAIYGRVLELSQRCWRESESQLDRFARLWSKDGSSMQAEILKALRSVGGEEESTAQNGERAKELLATTLPAEFETP